MNAATGNFSYFLFVGLPYAALAVSITGGLHRLSERRPSFVESLFRFSQKDSHMWGSPALPLALLAAVLIHLVALLAPGLTLFWNAHPIRLYILQVLSLMAGLLACAGLLLAASRLLSRGRSRFFGGRIRTTKQRTNILLLVLLGLQILSGILLSVFYPWGTSWMAAAGAPYLRSLLLFSPQIGYLEGTPWLLKLHLANAFLLIALLPYTRLGHLLALPLLYFKHPLRTDDGIRRER